MSEWILDASALLALLNQEPGAPVVEAALPDGVMSTVNLSEVLAKLHEVGLSKDEAWAAVSGLALTFVEFDTDAARDAAGLRPSTRTIGLSPGDRACVALGRARNAPILTADRSWSDLDVGVVVKLIL